MEIKKWLKEHPFFKYWEPVVIVMAIIAFFSLNTDPFSMVGVAELDAIDFNPLHVLAYFVLSLMMGIGFKHSGSVLYERYYHLFAILYSFVFGAFVELMQMFVPDRYSDLQGLAYNLAGILLAQMILYVYEIISKKITG